MSIEENSLLFSPQTPSPIPDLSPLTPHQAGTQAQETPAGVDSGGDMASTPAPQAEGRKTKENGGAPLAHPGPSTCDPSLSRPHAARPRRSHNAPTPLPKVRAWNQGYSPVRARARGEGPTRVSTTHLPHSTRLRAAAARAEGATASSRSLRRAPTNSPFPTPGPPLKGEG